MADPSDSERLTIMRRMYLLPDDDSIGLQMALDLSLTPWHGPIMISEPIRIPSLSLSNAEIVVILLRQYTHAGGFHDLTIQQWEQAQVKWIHKGVTFSIRGRHSRPMRPGWYLSG